MSDVHLVEGSVLCANGQHAWVTDAVARRTRGLCADCAVTHPPSQRRTIELVGRGHRTLIPLGGKRKPKKPKTPEARRRERLNDKARDRARKRLSFTFPDLYDIYLAEERAALGLDPWPLEVAVRSDADPDGTITEGFAAMLAELEHAGVDTT